MEVIKLWPSKSWQDAFCREATQETTQAGVRIATIELARLRRHGISVPWDEEDLVQQVLAATCGGTLTWNPTAIPLRIHLRDCLRQMVRRVRQQGDHDAAMVSLDELDDEDSVWSDPALSVTGPEVALVAGGLALRIESELWHLAAGDQVVLRVLGAMAEGETGNTGIASVTGLPLSVVENARKRIRRLAGAASPDLLADIRAELNIEAPTDGGV